MLGTTRLTGSVELGALWSALPEANPPPESGPWPPALRFQPVLFDRGRNFAIRAHRGYIYLRGQVPRDNAESIQRVLANYPDAVGARVESGDFILPVEPEDRWETGVGVTWPEPSPELVPPYPRTFRLQHEQLNAHWLVPAVGEESDRLTPLLLWWILLFGLSLLARYRPAEWRKALDLDRSLCAHRLMELLDEALKIVPDLLYEAAVGE